MPPPLRILIGLIFVSLSGIVITAVGQQTAPAQANEAAKLRDKGIAQFSTAEFKEAIATLRRAIELNPNDPVVWDYVAQAYQATWAVPEAIAAYDRSIQLRPDFAPTRLRFISYLFFATGDYGRTEKAANDTLAVAPQNPFPHYVIGTIRFRQQMPEAALIQAEAALSIDPKYGDALLLKSLALFTISQDRNGSTKTTTADTRKAFLQKAVRALEDFAQLGGHEDSAEYWQTQLETLRIMLAEFDLTAAEIPRIYRQNEVTQKARVTSKPPPEYTEEARQRGETGTIRLSAVLGADGTVSRIFLLYGLSAGLNAKAMAAMKKVQFNPALLDGKPVSQYVTFEYNFNIY